MENMSSFQVPEKNKLVPLSGGHVYDLIIAGGGPAGLTASVYAMRKGLDAALITGTIGGQVLYTYSVENYLGYKIIEGVELVNRFFDQAQQFPLAFRENTLVRKIEKDKGLFRVHAQAEAFLCRTVIVAAGKTYRRLKVPGEDEFTGKGVAWCTTCDAPLFREKRVAVIGGGNSGVQAALELGAIASHVTLLQDAKELTADKVLTDKLAGSRNVELKLDTKVTEIRGDSFVKGIKLEEKGRTYDMEVEGVFIEIGMVPSSDFTSDILRLNPAGEIVVDCACRTSVEGIFAAGDITSVPAKQIIVAAGEGAKAALSAYGYLMTSKR